jgi:hypothetical protein
MKILKNIDNLYLTVDKYIKISKNKHELKISCNKPG